MLSLTSRGPGFRAESLQLNLGGDETVESLIRPLVEHLEKLLDHGEDVDLDPKPSKYLLAWLSYFVRNPGKRSKVAIILRGVQASIPPPAPPHPLRTRTCPSIALGYR